MGLPANYFDEYTERIGAVTNSDLNGVAEQYLRPEQFASVVVGNRSVVEAGLHELRYPWRSFGCSGRHFP